MDQTALADRHRDHADVARLTVLAARVLAATARASPRLATLLPPELG